MMINCPKCNFLQPKDQYCAQCGVNMETYKPPAEPVWKKIASNWMVQLAVLFFIVFLVVLQDTFNPLDNVDFDESLPPVEEEIAYSDRPSQNVNEVQPLQAQRMNAIAGNRAKSQQKKLNTAGRFKEDAGAATALEKQAFLRVAMMSRGLLDRLSSTSTRVDGNSFVIGREELLSVTQANASEMKSIGQIRKPFEFGNPLRLFVGEEDLETGLRIGFYTQLNVEDGSNRNSIKVDARMWTQLQLSGDLGPQNTYDISMNVDSRLVVVLPEVHDISFTSEETALFEASSRLSPLNNEAFSEDLMDIILVLAIK